MSEYSEKDLSQILEAVTARWHYYRSQAHIYRKCNEGYHQYYLEKTEEFKQLEAKLASDIISFKNSEK